MRKPCTVRRTSCANALRGKNLAICKSRSGEYESALVLYHRAATVCPHDSTHGVAARRTAAMISLWSNPEKSSTRPPANTRSDAISRVTSCPESAVLRAPRDASKSSDSSIISGILRHLDTCKKPSTDTLPALGSLISQLSRSRATLEHVNSHADAMLRKLKATFDAGRMRNSLRLAEDLLALSPDLGDPRRHKIPAYHYLSLIHAALGRHDRASEQVARLVRLSLSVNDEVHLSQALVTLGKVHLSFGCLQAAARAWENMSIHVGQPVAQAWLHHEIGRCHFEGGKYVKALREAARCWERAEEASSNKWTFHAGLLRAQCLALLGRFAGDDFTSQPLPPFFPAGGISRMAG
ncbi:uncharacterized protein LOC112588769 [Harpegnathos saltator]|uniref:uncharacterized protein LOC112588769 n=1 Tax=Harpegnathos saltator TaxID=610380 RepID=UPI000DBEE056|nr:uncharacterized protein LOC112588769 [Harpegnathos saltator]